MDHEQKIYFELMGLAIKTIIKGKVPKTDPYILYGNMAIRRSAPIGRTEWDLLKNCDGKDFLASKDANGITSISVGEPGKHWLDRDYYIVYPLEIQMRKQKSDLTKPKGMESYDWLTLVIEGTRTVRGYYYGGRLCDEQLPEGYHRYDLRECDDEPGDIASIKDFILVNHHGTFITREVIECKQELTVTWWCWDPYEETFTNNQLDTLQEILHAFKSYNRDDHKKVLAAMDVEKKLTVITNGAYKPDTTYNIK